MGKRRREDGEGERGREEGETDNIITGIRTYIILLNS